MGILISGCKYSKMKTIKGLKAIIIDNSLVILSGISGLYTYNLINERLKKIYDFKLTFKSLLSYLGLPLRRLLRDDISIAISLDKENILYVKNRKIIALNISKSKINFEISIPRGSRPLNILKIESLNGFDDGIYFGEYFSNPEKKEVNIYKIENKELKSVFTFQKNTIDHIHNLIIDQKRNCIWILAGDFGTGAAIYQAKDNFKIVNKIVSGSQKFRSCVAFPIDEGLLYATDSQFESNSIKILYNKENNWVEKNIKTINGPCIYGTSINNKYYFSTSVEAINSGNLFQRLIRNKKGPGIIKNQSEIVSGDLVNGFKIIYENKKDRLPFILFQFGNILFPNGTNSTNKLIFTPIALKSNNFDTLIVDL